MKNVWFSRIFFQDFPGPGIFKKKIQDFPEGMGMLHFLRPITDTNCFYQQTQESSVWTIAAALNVLTN